MQRKVVIILIFCLFVDEKAPITFNSDSEIANFLVVEFLKVITS